ncbi:polysaccharide pyruvyl transferase family protein [Muricoccus radiodurans]|uniref:polysaccharide pyruvyl transferase family protein n=1 Tax=Muricoccus radiodurans TaxID=2231721 RepID=UPI003CEAD6B7
MSETSPVAGAGRKPRIGVLGPAGNITGRDDVESYWARDPAKSVQSFTNIGDSFVFDSSLKILEHAEVVTVSPSTGRGAEERLEKYRTLDYIFLRGSNYINPNGNWDATNALLEKIHVPVHAFGVGVQTPENAERHMNDSTERLFQIIAERSKSLAIRGELSAEALEKVGIKSHRIIGCPTVFRHRKRRISLPRTEAKDIRRLGFTLRRKTYGSATLQRYLIRTLDERFDMDLLCAGELEEKAYYYARKGVLPDNEAARAGAVASLVEDRWLATPGDRLLDVYDRTLRVFESVAGFEGAVRSLDAVTGFRLHGNLIALANGVPALYVVYDTRTREFVKTLGIPSVESKTMDKFSFEAAWNEAKWDRFEAAYSRRFTELESFLTENNLPHRLEARPAKIVATQDAA